jgi:hypothetical protein
MAMATGTITPPLRPQPGTQQRHPFGAVLWRQAQEIFGLDLRSLAVLRIGVGLILLVDLLSRAVDLRAHYTEEGVLPARDLLAPWTSCVHLLSGSEWFAAALFVLAGLFAVALVVGWHTRVATFASCFLLVSLHARNPLVGSSADVLLRLLLFWGLFLPLGARWSLDARRHPTPPHSGMRVLSVAGAALILQVCFVYWFGVALKSDPAWRTEGTAVYYALSIDGFATPLGTSLLAYPDLLWFLTFATLWLEAVGPVLLFVPFVNGPARVLAIAAFLLFHLVGLNLALELGIFPYVCAVGWLALLPGWFWDRAVPWLRGRAPAVPPPGTLPAASATPGWLHVLAGVCLTYVLLWNLRTVDGERYGKVLPPSTNWVGQALGLEQFWGMFAPHPLDVGGWYVIVGELGNGNEVDLFRNGAVVTWQKPVLVSATYRNERWRKYLMNLIDAGHAGDRPHYARYLWREWDARHAGDEQLAGLKIYFMVERTCPNSAPPPPPQRVLLYECSACPD